jgi:hypothetical protein
MLSQRATIIRVHQSTTFITTPWSHRVATTVTISHPQFLECLTSRETVALFQKPLSDRLWSATRSSLRNKQCDIWLHLSNGLNGDWPRPFNDRLSSEKIWSEGHLHWDGSDLALKRYSPKLFRYHWSLEIRLSKISVISGDAEWSHEKIQQYSSEEEDFLHTCIPAHLSPSENLRGPWLCAYHHRGFCGMWRSYDACHRIKSHRTLTAMMWYHMALWYEMLTVMQRFR